MLFLFFYNSRHINALDEDHCTPLHIACESDQVSDDIVKNLMQLGADASISNAHKETPLHFAAKNSPSKLKVKEVLC